MNYADWDAYDLLEALELSGAEPPPDLIAACLNRGADVVPGLLAWLEEDVDESWAEEDPRRYRPIHAGLLLIELRATEALPQFEAIYRDEERLSAYFGWFTPRLPLYEGAVVEPMAGLVADAEASEAGRRAAIYVLEQAALRSEPARAEVLTALDASSDDLAEAAQEARDAIEAEAAPQTMPDLTDFYAAGGGAVEGGPSEEELLEQLTAAGVDPKMAKMVLGRLSDRLGDRDADPGDVMADLAREMARAQGASAAQAEAAARRARAAAAQGETTELTPAEPVTTFARETPKYGRNDQVTIEHPETGETQTLKFKHAEKLLGKGWELRLDA